MKLKQLADVLVAKKTYDAHHEPISMRNEQIKKNKSLNWLQNV